MSVLVQWTEDGGGELSGEELLPTLPTPGQYISFAHVTNVDDDAVEFRIERATWHIESGILEGHIMISRTTG